MVQQLPTKQARVLIIDDEVPARQRLVDLLHKDSDIAAVFEAGDGATAMRAIQELRPDVVFLDIQMPELNGFGVIEAVGAEAMPLTIFVTAFDQHAIRAFEANALDYLLKPFSDERFETALARAKTRLEESSLREFGQHLFDLAAQSRKPGKLWDRLVVKSGGTTRFVRVSEIDWIEGAGVYVNLHIKGKEILHRITLLELTERLDPERFVRIHRRAMVNIDSILHLEPISHGEFEVVLKDGARSRVSRSYRTELEQRLGQTL